MEAIRVLHVLGGTSLGGAESRIMDIFRNIDRNKVQFDFMVHTRQEEYFNEEIRRLGGRIYHVPKFRGTNILTYRKAWKDFFREHNEFRAVHGHMTSTASIYLPIAGKSGVPITIAHARSAGTDPGLKGVVTRLLRHSLYRKTDYCFACSAIAGESVFGKKQMDAGRVSIVPNAIEVDKYRYDESVREEMRMKLSLQNSFVIGHVGRFHYAKNHEFLLEIFDEILKKKKNARLLLLGEGGLMDMVKEKAEKLGILDKILFAGNHANVEDYYQVMDYLVFPSRFEGLPGTVIEAQAAGLRCLISDTITGEVLVTGLVGVMSLQEPPAKWAERVLSEGGAKREAGAMALRDMGFDVKGLAGKLEEFYRCGMTPGGGL